MNRVGPDSTHSLPFDVSSILYINFSVDILVYILCSLLHINLSLNCQTENDLSLCLLEFVTI